MTFASSCLEMACEQVGSQTDRASYGPDPSLLHPLLATRKLLQTEWANPEQTVLEHHDYVGSLLQGTHDTLMSVYMKRESRTITVSQGTSDWAPCN